MTTRHDGPDIRVDNEARDRTRLVRDSTETKASFKTTELYVLLATVAGVLIAAYADNDSFSRDHAWTLVAALAIGYMISRGLAKLGSREPYFDRR